MTTIFRNVPMIMSTVRSIVMWCIFLSAFFSGCEIETQKERKKNINKNSAYTRQHSTYRQNAITVYLIHTQSLLFLFFGAFAIKNRYPLVKTNAQPNFTDDGGKFETYALRKYTRLSTLLIHCFDFYFFFFFLILLLVGLYAFVYCCLSCC